MQRAKDQEACGCDEVHGTQISYDDSRGEVIVLDDDNDDNRGNIAPSSSARLTQHADKAEDKEIEIGKLGRQNTSDEIDRGKRIRPFVEAAPSCTQRSRKAKQGTAKTDVIDLTETDSEEGSPDLSKKKHPSLSQRQWTCNACTFVNESACSRCEMCNSPCTP